MSSEDNVQWKPAGFTPQDDLELLRKTYASIHSIPVRHIVSRGNASDVIVRVAKDEKASLIVMGTHGRKGIGRFVLGSVAEHVLRLATCPVVTIKGDWIPPVE